MGLEDFLVKAKKSTYASGERPELLADGFERFVFEDGEYTYVDRYHARDPKPFGGEEVVWQNRKVIWMMNYFGGMVSDNVNSKAISSFLRKALSLVEINSPFRGPSEFREGEFVYINDVEGDVERFKGKETILFREGEVYRLEYQGGAL